ncbi:ribbon-helix-helix domain-containing protein [Treponema sp. R6D11]
MPLLQVRDFPGDVYEQIKFEAKRQHRTIAQQTVVLIKDGLEKEFSGRERRLAALERTRNRFIPEEAKDFDVVKSIREDRNR